VPSPTGVTEALRPAPPMPQPGEPGRAQRPRRSVDSGSVHSCALQARPHGGRFRGSYRGRPPESLRRRDRGRRSRQHQPAQRSLLWVAARSRTKVQSTTVCSTRSKLARPRRARWRRVRRSRPRRGGDDARRGRRGGARPDCRRLPPRVPPTNEGLLPQSRRTMYVDGGNACLGATRSSWPESASHSASQRRHRWPFSTI
jgi:hypothetical protein